jgi:putative PIN family toxin of toxin-antitoxin system
MSFLTIGDVVREVLGAHEFLVSDYLVQELEQVLLQKFLLPPSLVADILALLRQDSIPCEASPFIDLPLKDPDDVPILSCAIYGKADMLVTGDKELLGLTKVGDVLILSPRAFWEHLKGS